MVISSEPHTVTAGHKATRVTNQEERITVDNAPTPTRRMAGPDNAAIPARLTVIEERLDEIIRRLDEMKDLLTTLDRAQPNRQRH